VIAKKFIGRDPVALILGDNVFYGQGLSGFLQDRTKGKAVATILAHVVRNPSAYAVPVFDEKGRIMDLEEKPANPKSSFAIPGLYFYGPEVVQAAERLRPSARGEFEITDLNRHFLERGELRVEKLGRGAAWFDAGTPEALLEASNFIRTIEHRQGVKVGCLEEVAFRMGFIGPSELRALANKIAQVDYRQYLLDLLDERSSLPTASRKRAS
jgi:glucose-1-phosphate thymidylyltransferase